MFAKRQFSSFFSLTTISFTLQINFPFQRFFFQRIFFFMEFNNKIWNHKKNSFGFFFSLKQIIIIYAKNSTSNSVNSLTLWYFFSIFGNISKWNAFQLKMVEYFLSSFVPRGKMISNGLECQAIENECVFARANEHYASLHHSSSQFQ